MKIIVVRNGIANEVKYIGTPLLSEVLEGAGYGMPHPCGGRGVCAKCRVFVNGSQELSCQYRLGDEDGITVEIPDAGDMKQIELEGGDVVFMDPMPGAVGSAIDIGTTTVAIRNYDLVNGRQISEIGFINPQTEVAADVMGRIDAAMKGSLQKLQQQICEAIEYGLEQTETDPDSMVITGNTTMLYLLAGLDPSSLSHAPFEAGCLFDTKLNFGPTIAYLPPCMHAFVGADITCAVMASGMCESDETALLVDIGTNGEIALWKDGKLFVSSTAAGPAFEGAGISCGCGSVAGAIDSVAIDSVSIDSVAIDSVAIDSVSIDSKSIDSYGTEGAKIKVHTIGEAPAVGVCGSGLIDAIACFLDLGLIEETGGTDEDELPLADGVALEPKDISMVQLAKSAIAAGMATMMNEAGITPDDISRVYIAGGFGSHLNIDSAIRIGLLPAEFRDKISVIGNAALTGAAQILADMEKIDVVRRIASTSQHVNLGGNPMFNNLYMENIIFP